MQLITRSVGLAALLVVSASLPATAQSAGSLDAGLLEQVCRENAPDESTRDDCLAIVRDVLAPGGTLVLPAAPVPTDAADGGGVGTTQSTDTLLVTLLAVAWDSAIFPRDDLDVVAAEFAFESIHPEAYVDLGGLVAVDEDGFAHAWGALHDAGESPPAGFLAEGRKVRGWVGFELPPGTSRLELEFQDGLGGQRLVWSVER